MSSNRNTSVPPQNLNGISRPGRMGANVVKPKDLKGTLLRLWNLTRGHRNGLGFILILSALASAASIISPYLTGKIVTTIKDGSPVGTLLIFLIILYVSEWLIKFLPSARRTDESSDQRAHHDSRRSDQLRRYSD